MSSVSRTPGSALTREAIAAVAIAIADEEGFDAVSMRRVAARLGAGTMSLYHYVSTKDDLLSLMGNAIMGEVVIPDGEMPTGWRAGLREIAMRTKAGFDRHPWLLAGMLHGDEGAPGPNLMRHADQTLGTVAGLGLTPQERLHLTGIVDEYVMGHVFRARVERRESEAPGFSERMTGWLQAQLSTDDFPHFRELFAGLEPTSENLAAFWAQAQGVDRFEPGLELVLDGIECHLSRRSPPSAPSPR